MTAEKREPVKRIYVDVPDSVYRKLKAEAATRGMFFKVLIAEVLKNYRSISKV